MVIHQALAHPQDPRKALQDLTQRAAQYCINLDGYVFKDNTFLLRGGSGIVFPGTMVNEAGATDSDLRSGQKVAIKIPRAGPPNTDANIKKFLKEVHVWSKLKHPNILPLLGITTEFDLTVSIVSPWMNKGNAHDYVQNKAVDPRPLIKGTAHGLHYLHNHSPSAIFHGDLKGINVLISDNGQALLSDFGFSLLVNSSFSMTLSNHGGTKGTLMWKSPQILEGGEVSAESDVWAFGMTVLELFTRKNPFHSMPTAAAIMFKIITGMPDRPSVSDTCKRMTNEWWDICTRCWEHNPTSRPTMMDIIEVLKMIN
ncbi:kinase-like domain-containing protein [Scleroderma yunnanense]